MASIDHEVSNTPKCPEDHKLVTACFRGPTNGERLGEFFQRTYDLTRDWAEPHFRGYYGDTVAGYVPLTDKELAARERRRAAAAAANASKREKQRKKDEAQLLKLAEKLGREVK